MSKLGDTIIPALMNTPPGSVGALVAHLAQAGNVQNPTAAEVAELIDLCRPVGGVLLDAPLAMLSHGLHTSEAPRAFPNLHSPTVVCQAVWRLFDPGALAQKNTETCGPVAFVIDLCRQRPLEYVRTLVTLMVTGKAKLKDLDLAPGSNVCNRRPNEIAIAQVDWIMVGSLRDSLTGLNIYGLVRLFKEVEDFGILPDSMFDWLAKSGYGSVVLLGQRSLSNALMGKYSRRVWGNPPGGFDGLPLTQEGMAKLAQTGTDSGYSVFLFVDDRLSEALTKGTTHFETLYAMNEIPGAKEVALQQQELRQQQGRQALLGADKGGHVMLLAELKIGFYVSVTAFNRGELVYHHTLPKDAFFSCIRTVIVATDRTI